MPKNVWEILWDYDPNGLLVLDETMEIKLVNPGFVRMFYLQGADIIGKNVFEFFDNVDDFYEIMESKKESIKKVNEYTKYRIITSEVIFRIPEEKLIVKIFHDITEQERKEKELTNLKLQVIDEVQKIVDKQMKVGQEIASILGETTAETKSTLVKLLTILKKES